MDGERLPASYANFYIANGVVLVPTFNDPNDRVALETLAGCMPAHRVVGIHAVDLVWGLGTLALPDAAGASTARTRAAPVIEAIPDGVVISVRVIPRAARSGLAGTRGGALLVRLQSPPVEGAANDELIEVMARALQVPKRAVSIVAGDRSRQKRVRVVGIDAATAASRLG